MWEHVGLRCVKNSSSTWNLMKGLLQIEKHIFACIFSLSGTPLFSTLSFASMLVQIFINIYFQIYFADS